MPDNKVKVHYVQSCNLGKFGSKGVALRMNFAMSADTLKKGPHRSAVFGLTPELARGLAKALTTVLDEPAKAEQTKPTVN
jgi:hypothetical protein